MYYHFRLDKYFDHGGVDASARREWDFRSLRQGLMFVKREFGTGVENWRIEDLTDSKSDLLFLESALKVALESTYQYIIMTLKEGSELAKRYGWSQLFVVVRDEAERPASFLYSEADEQAITAPETIFQPDYRRSVRDILKSFDVEHLNRRCFEQAIAAIADYYCDEEDVPEDVRSIIGKEGPSASDCVLIADECQSCGEEQLAATLYALAIVSDGLDETTGEALAKLAELYMDSEWPKSPARELDVMKAMDLLVESLCRGYPNARDVAEGMREQLFEDYIDGDEIDADDLINRYEVDVLCFAGFCLGVGLGWRKDTAMAAKLYEYALDKGYERASHYLNEIKTGRV